MLSGCIVALMAPQMSTETQRIERAAAILAAGRDTRDNLPPHQAAQLAWAPGGPTVAQLTELICRQRAARAA